LKKNFEIYSFILNNPVHWLYSEFCINIPPWNIQIHCKYMYIYTFMYTFPGRCMDQWNFFPCQY